MEKTGGRRSKKQSRRWRTASCEETQEKQSEDALHKKTSGWMPSAHSTMQELRGVRKWPYRQRNQCTLCHHRGGQLSTRDQDHSQQCCGRFCVRWQLQYPPDASDSDAKSHLIKSIHVLRQKSVHPATIRPHPHRHHHHHNQPTTTELLPFYQCHSHELVCRSEKLLKHQREGLRPKIVSPSNPQQRFCITTPSVGQRRAD